MKLFTVGPVEMYPATLEIRSKQLPYFRTNEFSKLMLENDKMLKEVLFTSQNSKCAFITGSGSAAMEVVVSNCFDESDKVLIVNGGTFGERFVRICQIYHIPYDEVGLKFNEELNAHHLDKYINNRYTALLANIDETSTGQLYDIQLLKDFCKNKNMWLIVDAISSFLSDSYRMDEMGIDCTIIASQKALALAPGLSMIVVNEKFYEERVKNKNVKNLYLNLNEHIVNMERGQTPNTPAVGICLELHQRLNDIINMGVENHVDLIRSRALYFREKVKDLGLSIPEYPLSNTLTPIVFNQDNAKMVYQYLKENYDIIVTPNGGKLADTVLRIGHIGNLSLEDYDVLIERLKEIT